MVSPIAGNSPDLACSPLAPHECPCLAAGISCPTNSHYESCSRGCSQTCSSIYSPVKCSGQCREGCDCDDGFVLSGDECVPVSRCGCLHQDFYYKMEETFFPTKQEKCQCQDGNAVDCQEVSCPGDSEGKVIDGVFQCPSAARGACVATGDRSYISFDGMAFNISGACSYILTETCNGDGVKPFLVKIEKSARQKKKVSVIRALSVEVYGLTLTLMRGRRGAVTVRRCFVVCLFLVVTKSVGSW